MARSWILRLRLKSSRRMTALLVGSKNQMGMMGGFSPLLEKLIFLTKNYLFLSRTQIEVKGMLSNIPIIMFLVLPDLLM